MRHGRCTLNGQCPQTFESYFFAQNNLPVPSHEKAKTVLRTFFLHEDIRLQSFKICMSA